jgi:hypothetical protein
MTVSDLERAIVEEEIRPINAASSASKAVGGPLSAIEK